MPTFVPIPQAPKYGINKNGEVINFRTQRKLKLQKMKIGYLQAQCYVGPGRQDYVTLYIHRLVAQLFIPNPENKPQVCHRNDIKTDNRLENLYWGTPADNMRDKALNGNGNEGSKHGMAKLTEPNVKYIKRLLALEQSHRRIAKLFNVSHATIDYIATNKRWRHVA